MRRTSSILNKHRSKERVYLPSDARDNQYIIAQFELTDELFNAFSPTTNHHGQPYLAFYQNLSALFFKLCQQYEIVNALFIANDKLVQVRYNHEMHQWQTNQQILFYYNPSIHQLNNAFYDGNVRADNIRLLFLASGDDIHLNSVRFHAKIHQCLQAFNQTTSKKLLIDILDHQHLTYDLLLKLKAGSLNKKHKLQHIQTHYSQEHYSLPPALTEMTYAIITLPLNHEKTNTQTNITTESHNALYGNITHAFIQASKQVNLSNGALIANGLIPIIRYTKEEIIAKQGELQILGVPPKKQLCGFISKWHPTKLTSNIQLIFIANQDLYSELSVIHFLNQVEQVINLMLDKITDTVEQEKIQLRFHQNIAYQL